MQRLRFQNEQLPQALKRVELERKEQERKREFERQEQERKRIELEI